MSEQPARSEVEPPAADPEWVLSAERQLHLLDQVIGLRARLAEETARGQARLAQANAEHEAALALLHTSRTADADLRVALATVEAELVALRQSQTWRVGRLVTGPADRLRRLVRGRRTG